MTRSLSSVLIAACETMLTLAIFPMRFEADPEGARILTVMRSDDLVERSVGPYSPQNLPPECLRLIDLILLRWSMRPERPDFTVAGGGRWPELCMDLPDSGVQVWFVVPEAAPPGYQPPAQDVGVASDVRLTLQFLVRSIAATGKDLPMAVSLHYPPDPDFEARRARMPAEIADLIPPVIPTVELDRRHCRRRQRKAHDEAVRAIAYKGQKIESPDGSGFSTRIGLARLRTAHG